MLGGPVDERRADSASRWHSFFSSNPGKLARSGFDRQLRELCVCRATDTTPPPRLPVLGWFCCCCCCCCCCCSFSLAVGQAVDDDFTRSASSGVGGMVGEATAEAEHRVIEELGPKRRLLMAVNESKAKPVREGKGREGKGRDGGDRSTEGTRLFARRVWVL